MEQAEATTIDMMEQLARREQQLDQLRNAYIELQRSQTNQQEKDRVIKNISHLPIFTGTGSNTINSFFSSVEYMLSTLTNEETMKEAVRTVFYRVIQGEAKDVVINIQETHNWNKIKEALKRRYRPDTEPHEIYRKISNLKVNSVSELAVELQNIKYKADELNVYYQGDHSIDLTNIDRLLVNITKEMTQGTLLDRIYDKRNLDTIIETMNKRRYEDSCIRW